MAAKKAKTKAKAKTTAKPKAAAKPKVAAKAKTTAKPKAAAKPKAVAKTKATAKSKAVAKAKRKTASKASTATKNVKMFDSPKFQEFTIRDNAGVVGHVRLKPNAVAWKPKSKKIYQQISMDQLAAFAAEHGREVRA